MAVVVALAPGCVSGIKFSCNVTGAGVRDLPDQTAIARLPAQIPLAPSRPHTLQFFAPGYEPEERTFTPHSSTRLAVAYIVADIFEVPLVIGIIGLVVHIGLLVGDPYWPGVFDEEEVHVELKPIASVTATGQPDVKKPASAPVK